MLYKTYFRTSSGRGTEPFQTSYERRKEYHFESRAEEGQSINSSEIPNLTRKWKGILLQVTRSSRTLNLVRKKVRVSFSLENPKPRAEEEGNIKVLNYFEPRAEEDKSINKSRSTLNLERRRIEVLVNQDQLRTSSGGG